MVSYSLASSLLLSYWVVISPSMCQNKEIAVVGLFQVKETLNGQCDDSRTYIPSVMALEAVKWTFQKLYDSGDIPRIKFIHHKTCGISQKSAEKTIEILSNKQQNYSVVGIIGPEYSQEAKIVSEIITSLPETQRIAQVSYSATASLLGNKTLFPNFFRVIPNDDVQVRTMVQLLLKLEWNRIAILYDNDLYGLEIVQTLTTMATSEGICIPAKYEISSNTEQNREVLDKLLITANPPLKGVIFVGRQEVGHLFLKLMETSAYTNTPALILCEAMQLQLKTFSDTNGNVFDKSKGSFVVSPEYFEVTEFTAYWKDLFVNHSSLIYGSESNPWLLDIHDENFGCSPDKPENCTPPTRSKVDELFLKQPVYVRYAVLSAYTIASSIKQTVLNLCPDAAPCQEFFDQINAPNTLTSIAKTSFSLGDNFNFTPDSLREEKVSFSGNATLTERSGADRYGVYNLQSSGNTFKFSKIADFNGTTITLLGNEIKDYYYNSATESLKETSWPNIRRAQCPTGYLCQECINENIEDEFIFIKGDLYILAMVPYRQSDSKLGCGNPTESNLNGYGNTVAIQKAVQDSNELKQFGEQSIGLVIFDSCSNPTQSDWRIKDTLKHGVKLKNGSTIDITEKIIGVVASYFSSVSVAISRTLTSLKMLHVAYGATSPTLSDRVVYPYFTRVSTPDNRQADATVRILLKLGINYIQVTVFFKAPAAAHILPVFDFHQWVYKQKPKRNSIWGLGKDVMVVLLIYSDDAYGVGFKDSFSAAAEAEKICIDNMLGLDAESSSEINKIYDLLRNKPHAKLVVVSTSTFMNELLDSLTKKMIPGEFLFLGSESWGINDNMLKLPSGNKLIGSITINLELPDVFGVESSMKNVDHGYKENKNPWTESYLQSTMQCYYSTSFDKKIVRPCEETFESYWTENNLKISNWGNFAYLGTQALLNSSSEFFMGKCNTRSVVCDEYRAGIDVLIDNMKRNSKITINGQQSRVFDGNGDGDIGYVIYNIQNTGGILHYTEVGRYSADSRFDLNLSKMVAPSGEPFQSVCPSEKACLECLPKVIGAPEPESSPPPTGSIILGSLFGLTFLVLIAALIIVYLQHKRFEKLQQTGDGYLTPTDVTSKYMENVYSNTITANEIPESSTEDGF